jgi:DNA-binding GntR family transcriptional regulator
MQITETSRTLRAQALAILRAQILSGGIAPGERLNEVQLAAEIGVSRGTLREAIRTLEQDGLLVSVAHKGSHLRRFTAREAEELQETRLSLEVTAAIRVAHGWNAMIERVLEERLASLAQAVDGGRPFPDRLAADLAFHEAICECSGNRTLLAVWQSLIGHISVMVLNVGESEMTPLQDPRAHRPLIDVIASGDEAAIRDMFADHFAAGQRVVFAAINTRD